MLASIACKVVRTAFVVFPKILSNRTFQPVSYAKNLGTAAIKSNSSILSKFNNQYPILKLILMNNVSTLNYEQKRNVTKFSLKKGKRKTAKAVLKRFKRLDWGIWIRTHSGRNKRKFHKSQQLKKRLQQHIFVNSTQSWLLDKMVSNYWRKPKYYIEDPYEQYHQREDFFITRTKPI